MLGNYNICSERMILELAKLGTMEETIAKVVQGRTFLHDVQRKISQV
ncbi:MAG TPA: hypothetical protein PLR25_18610 [Planctomycetaceae bacterium]|nr:hypothetical protein [Planctomycetaceae bacterium]